MRVKDKSIIVTGSGGGIGEGIAHRLAAEGARVIVNDIDSARGEKVAAALADGCGDLLAAFHGDVVDDDLGALGGQAMGDALADASARAGDDDGFVLDAHVAFFPWRISRA